MSPSRVGQTIGWVAIALVVAVSRGLSQAPSPTYADAHYGPFERNRLDFWEAAAGHPKPVLIFIHGGGFVKGDKTQIRNKNIIRECLSAGVSFAAIDYRFLGTAHLQDILRDAGRAVQFIRSNATAWEVNKSKIGAYGSSGGAGMSLWLDFHDDLADPTSPDPVLRESSRLACAGADETQFSYDLYRWSEIFDQPTIEKYSKAYPASLLYGFETPEDATSPSGRKIRAECDIISMISKDDGPVFLDSTMRGGPTTDEGQFLHHPRHAQLIYEKCKDEGVPVVAHIPALGLAPAKGQARNLEEFLLANLTAATQTPAK